VHLFIYDRKVRSIKIAIGAKGNWKSLPMELMKNNPRVVCLVVLFTMSTTLFLCGATGRNKGMPGFYIGPILSNIWAHWLLIRNIEWLMQFVLHMLILTGMLYFIFCRSRYHERYLYTLWCMFYHH
jgi:hypothetical protein